MDVHNLISGSSAFSKSSFYIWKFSVHLLLYVKDWRILSIKGLKPRLKDFEHHCQHVKGLQLCGSLTILWHCSSLGLEWKLTFSNSPVATAEFSKFAGTLTASSFRIWNSSAGISSPLLALFVVMLPKAHLTSYSRMSGSKWVTTSSWLTGSLRDFFV